MFNIYLRPTNSFNITLQDQGESGGGAVYIIGDIEGIASLDANAAILFTIDTSVVSNTGADGQAALLYTVASTIDSESTSEQYAIVIRTLDANSESITAINGEAGLRFTIDSDANSNAAAASNAGVIYGVSGSVDNGTEFSDSIFVLRVINGSIDSGGDFSAILTVISPFFAAPPTPYFPTNYIPLGGFPVYYFPNNGTGEGGGTSHIIIGNIDGLAILASSAVVLFTIDSSTNTDGDASSNASVIYGISGSVENNTETTNTIFVTRIVTSNIDEYSIVDSSLIKLIIADGDVDSNSDISNETIYRIMVSSADIGTQSDISSDIRMLYSLGGNAATDGEIIGSGGLIISGAGSLGSDSDAETQLLKLSYLSADITEVAELLGVIYNRRTVGGDVDSNARITADAINQMMIIGDLGGATNLDAAAAIQFVLSTDIDGGGSSDATLNGIFTLNATCGDDGEIEASCGLRYICDTDVDSNSIIIGTIDTEILEILYTLNADLYIYRQIPINLSIKLSPSYNLTTHRTINYFDVDITRTLNVSISIDRG